jgi:transcriptional regulator with XRE-family HTH domain
MIGDCSKPRGAPRLPNFIDQHVGARVRVRRLMVGMSQIKLAEALEVSSKQVRKYERGANKISASRLQQIARVLRVPLPYFFDGDDGALPHSLEAFGHSNSIAFFMTSEALRLVRVFASIRHPAVRRNVLLLIESLTAADPYGRSPDEPRRDGGPLST